MTTTISFQAAREYDQRHGGPFDRGSADSYYGRGHCPHYYEGPTMRSREITIQHMTAEQIAAYTAGYEWNEMHGDKKNWD